MLLQSLLGKMDFRCILLPNEPWAMAGTEGEEDEVNSFGGSQGSHAKQQKQAVMRASKEKALAAAQAAGLNSDDLKLWGLTLGMTM